MAADDISPLVQLVGYFRFDLGLSHATRLLAQSLEHAGISYQRKNYDNVGLHRPTYDAGEESTGGDAAPIVIYGVNMDNIPNFIGDMPADFAKGGYRIGYWFWEVPTIPEFMHRAFEEVDEIWVASEYMRGIFSRYFDKPISCFPQPILLPPVRPPALPRHSGIPFRYYFCFDFCSVLNRKNPQGLLRAFLRAFPEPGEAELLIKSVNGDLFPEAYASLQQTVKNARHVFWVDGHLPQNDLRSLLTCADAYVSLHRAEGYGLTLSEAMALGKPVIATGYSGNMAFMNEENSFLIPYDLRPVGAGSDPYPPDDLWAEPDENEAARMMRHIVENPTMCQEKTAEAFRQISRYFSLEASGAWVKSRLEAIARQISVARKV